MKCLLVFLCLTGSFRAGHGAALVDKVTTEPAGSPRGDLLVQHYFLGDNTDQIWLVSTADPLNRQLLFTHQRHATVLFSSNEEWLVINDHNTSNGSRLLLFHQKEALKYEQVSDLTEDVWKFFATQNRLEKPPGFDHSYVEALRWMGEDAPTLLLCLSGHLDRQHYADDWLCFYDVKTKKFSTDLAAQNWQQTRAEGD